MTNKKGVEAKAETSKDAAKPPVPPARRGRPVKEPPAPKLWRIEGLSPEKMKVTLGRYHTQEEAEPEFLRLQEDGFYHKITLVQLPPEEEA